MAQSYPTDGDFRWLAIDRKKLMKAQTGSFDGKKNVWAPDEKEMFVKALIKSTKGDDVTVELEKGGVSLAFNLYLNRL